MPELKSILKVLEVLSPLIDETYDYLYGDGKKPEFMTNLPTPLRSQVALAALEAKRKVAKTT